MRLRRVIRLIVSTLGIIISIAWMIIFVISNATIMMIPFGLSALFFLCCLVDEIVRLD